MDSTESDSPASDSDLQRAGYVLLAGLPNAGKSTLLNALVGEPLSIVTAKAQTTWQRITGIRTDRGSQMVFLDTPGILAPRDLFQRSMLAEAAGARTDADLALCVIDAVTPPAGESGRRLIEFMGEVNCPKLFVANKCDAVEDIHGSLAEIERLVGATPLPISAETGAGLDEVLSFLHENLPEGPFLFPEDDIAQAPVRFFVQEFIRQCVFEHFEQEIPYSCAVKIEDFRESQDPVYIAATVFVERKSQKGMVVGKRGAAIRRLGAQARQMTEDLLGRRVYLDLWVKVAAGWRRNRGRLEQFGYRVPDDIPE